MTEHRHTFQPTRAPGEGKHPLTHAERAMREAEILALAHAALERAMGTPEAAHVALLTRQQASHALAAERRAAQAEALARFQREHRCTPLCLHAPFPAS